MFLSWKKLCDSSFLKTFKKKVINEFLFDLNSNLDQKIKIPRYLIKLLISFFQFRIKKDLQDRRKQSKLLCDENNLFIRELFDMNLPVL